MSRTSVVGEVGVVQKLLVVVVQVTKYITGHIKNVARECSKFGGIKRGIKCRREVQEELVAGASNSRPTNF